MSLNRKVTYNKKHITKIKLSFQRQVMSYAGKCWPSRGNCPAKRMRVSHYIFNLHVPEGGMEFLVLLSGF